MSIPRAKLHEMIKNEQDKIAESQKRKGTGITPDQEESRCKIAACEELLDLE